MVHNYVLLATGFFLNTRAESSYRQFWYSLSHEGVTSFKVKACEDASISLSKYPGVFLHSTYELVLGAEGNTKTKLRRDPKLATWDKEVSTPNIIACGQNRWFWISKYDDWLQVGRGVAPGNDVFFEYYDANHYPINSISFSTSSKAVGQWEYTHLTGGNYFF